MKRIVLLSIVVSAAFSTSVRPTIAGVDLQPVTLQLKWRHQFQFAGYYAAIEKGFYEEAGLRVNLLEPDVGTDPLDVLLNEDADFAVSTSEIVKRVASGAPLVALGVIYQHSPLVLVTLQDRGINTVHDLAGQTLAIEANSADLLAMLQAEGIDLDAVNFIPHSFSVDSLVEERAAALSAYVTDEPFVLEEMGHKTTVFSPRASGIDFYGDTLVTTQQNISDDPEMVEKFLKASLRGWNYAFRNEDEIIDLILSKYSQRKTRAQLKYEAMKTRQLVQPDLVEVGYMNPGRWQRIAEIFVEVGLLEEPVDPYSFLYQTEKPFPWKTFFLVGVIPTGIATAFAIFAFRLRKRKEELEKEFSARTIAEAKLKENERIYRSMVENAPLAFVLWDKDFRIRSWNAAAETMFGWKSDEVIGVKFMELIVPEDERARVAQNNADILKAGSTTFANWNLKKDGSRIWCEWHNMTRLDEYGELLDCQSIGIDATAKHLKQRGLETDMKAAIEAKDQKGRFLATVSHEVRNPLSAIIGMANLLVGSSRSGENKELAEAIADSGESMLRILNDLVEHEKIEAGAFSIIPSEIQPSAVLSKMVKMYKLVALEKGLKLIFENEGEGTSASLDPLRLEQIVTNLLSNAIKFTEKGEVRISYQYRSDSPLPVQIEVSDTGIGLGEEDLANIFNLFDRGAAKDKPSFQGSGIGLTVSKQLAELMGGALEAESKPNQGSRFYLGLPSEITTGNSS